MIITIGPDEVGNDGLLKEYRSPAGHKHDWPSIAL